MKKYDINEGKLEMVEASKSEASTGVGLGFLQVLGLIFITLKLCGVIDWSWWLVTLPIWIGLAIALFVIVAAVATVIALSLFSWVLRFTRNRKD